MGNSSTHVMVYHGYGHTDNLIIYGHVLKTVPGSLVHNAANPFSNLLQLLRLFSVTPLGGQKVRLFWQNEVFDSVSEADGMFKFEWKSKAHVAAGWHPLKVAHLSSEGNVLSENSGLVFVPHITQYAFISDVDDTVMISHSATIFRRMKELMTKGAGARSVFPGVAAHYKLLAASNTSPETPNPFFYVSSSEWNLYAYLVEVFRLNKLPVGIFLLSQLKRWTMLLKTGKTKHEAKLLRIMRILEAFKLQQFVLLGDNSQSDPIIYESIASRYPGKIHAVYIRNVHKEKEAATRELLDALQQKGVHTLLFEDSVEAIAHSKKIGLIAVEIRG